MAQRKNKLKIALIYDFDGTLSPLNMQEYDFLKSLHIEKDAFWAETNDLVKKKNANNVLCYMKLMLEKAASKHVPVRYKNFVEFGKSIQLYKGVEQWFDLVNELGRKNDIVVEHYINSSGLKEMIEGTPVYKHFKQVYASNFMYDENGNLRDGYIAFKERCRGYVESGIKVMAVTPYATEYIANGADPRTAEGEKNARATARFLVEDLKGFVAGWQITNEMGIPRFTIPLTMDAAIFPANFSSP